MAYGILWEEVKVSGGLRFAPAPPNVSGVPASGNLYPSGPSPYTCPGVDKPPDTPYHSQMLKAVFFSSAFGRSRTTESMVSG